MTDSQPVIGVFTPSPWARACRAISDGRGQVLELPGVPESAGPSPSVQDRLAAGRAAGADDGGPRPDLLLDSGAVGFQFVEGPGGLVKPIIVQAAQADLGGTSFAEIYYDLYRLNDPPQPEEDRAVLQTKAQNFFSARLFYEAGLGIRQRDRFVICLVRVLGQQFQVRGSGWKELYGIAADADPQTAEAHVDHYRGSAINIALGRPAA
jgi:hypothetical protein